MKFLGKNNTQAKNLKLVEKLAKEHDFITFVVEKLDLSKNEFFEQ